MDELNANLSQAFKELASRCHNLCVLQNHHIEHDDARHSNLFSSLRLYNGLLHPLSHRVKPLCNTSFCMTMELPYITAYMASCSRSCTSSILRA